jgi:arylsulfatase A-like enzyme
MQGQWDAPYALRTQWSDEDDPAPPDFVEPPARRLPEKIDPDELLGMVHAYAAQVTVLDECFELFFNTFLESRRAEDTLLVFTSPRGYPLGEHRRIGAVDPALYGEALRTPLLLRFPDGAGAAHRAQAIVQPPDLFATLAEWMNLAHDPSPTWGRSLAPLMQGDPWPRDRALAVDNHQRAIRTPAWFLRQSTFPEDSPQVELYVKPDDQWEINEVSDRVPAVVEELTAALDHLEQAVQANDEARLTPLSEALCEGV